MANTAIDNRKEAFLEAYDYMMAICASDVSNEVKRAVRADFYALRNAYIANGVDVLTLTLWTQDARKAAQS